eukprot:365449-Chlamydomonas_euryale.AAC.2
MWHAVKHVGIFFNVHGGSAPWPEVGAHACTPDMQETIGSAIAIFILSGGAIPLWAGCILISVTAFLLLLLDRFGFRCARPTRAMRCCMRQRARRAPA